MTRLADALQRAKDRNNTARSPVVAAPAGPTPVVAPVARLAVAPAVRVPAAMVGEATSTGEGVILVKAPDREPAPRTETSAVSVGGTSLIARPSRDQLATWRSNPDLAGKLVGTDGFAAGAQEQYRKLAAILHHAQGERGLKVIMVTSALPNEGKSLTVVNLALTLSESYHRRVLLIDTDLRRPTVQGMFGIPPLAGLNEGLKATEDRPMAITPVSERLFVLPAGRPEADPMSGLTSERMRRLIAQAASAFDWVIVDSPPVGLLPDANLLAAFVDGVLLVVRAGKTPFALVKRTVESISHERILGVVMNAIDIAHDRNAGGYYQYYGGGYYAAPDTN
jgi:capsular exopolysaccharide synthesis family protein